MTPTGKSILCVEDNADDRELIQTYLGMEGYDVTFAITVAEGLSKAESGRFDLYLVDEHLPDGLGVDLVHQQRAFDSLTPLVFHSASTHVDPVKMALAVGAQAYITKPSDPDMVIQTITTLIAESRLKTPGH
jgi:DNA-binding response OmpR family regulator